MFFLHIVPSLIKIPYTILRLFSLLKITMGHNHVGGGTVLSSTYCLVLVYICIKFCKKDFRFAE